MSPLQQLENAYARITLFNIEVDALFESNSSEKHNNLNHLFIQSVSPFWINTFFTMPLLNQNVSLGKTEKRFLIFEFRLGINFFYFSLRHFREVEERLGSPEAWVETDSGWKRELFCTFWNKAEQCQTNTLQVKNSFIFFYHPYTNGI